MEWINYSKQKPPFGKEVIAYNKKWIDEDLILKVLELDF